jgi:2'-5' RNA ligase
MGTIRTFVAVDISPEIRSAAQKQIRAFQALGVEGYKWVEQDEMHLTLKFLGDIRDNESPEVCKLVQRAVQNCEPVVLNVAGLGSFPSADRPRTLWMGITEGMEEIRELQSRVDQALKEMGFPQERNEFTPHITLGRLNRGNRSHPVVSEYIANNSATPFGSIEIDEVIVYSSFGDRSGRTYTPMATIGLDG